MKTIWIDLETTGLNPDKDHIIEIAAVYIDAFKPKTNHVYHRFVLPDEKPSDWTDDNVSGITWDFLMENGVSSTQFFHEFRGWLDSLISKFDKMDKAVIGGYNPKFENDFLRALFIKYGSLFFGSYFIPPQIDVQNYVAEAFSTGKIPVLSNFKQSTVYAYLFGKELENKHSALADIIASIRIFCELKKNIRYEKKLLTLFPGSKI